VTKARVLVAYGGPPVAEVEDGGRLAAVDAGHQTATMFADMMMLVLEVNLSRK
jgi:hypothetical protein